VGGLVIAIGSRVAVYHEAIAWGAAFALLAAWESLRYLRARTLARLAAVAGWGALAILSREIWLLGIGALLLVLGLAALVPTRPAPGRGRLANGAAGLKRWLGLPDVTRPLAHAAVAAGTIAAVLFGMAAIHRAKFGEWGFVPPIDRHLSFRDSARLQRIGGRLFHLANLPTGAYNYGSPGSAEVGPRFPWIGPTPRIRVLPGAHVDGVEHFFGLPHLAGALLLLGGLGALSLRTSATARSAFLVALPLALSSASVLCFVGFCGRYLYDFYPPLAVAGGAGLAALRAGGSPGLRRAVRLLAVYNLAAGLSMAFVVQRSYADGERRSALRAFGERIDAALSLR
jgi:hypothetical protein